MRSHFIRIINLILLLMVVSGCASRKPYQAIPEESSESAPKSGPQSLKEPDLKPAESKEALSPGKVTYHREPTNGYYHFIEAQIQRKKGKLDKALNHLQKAIKGDSGSIYLRHELVKIYLQQQNYEGALEVVEKIRAEVPDDLEALILFGRIKDRLNMTEDAKKAYKEVLARDAKQSQIYLLLGRIYFQEKKLAQALQVYKTLLNHFPESYAGYFFIGKISAERGDSKAALKAFKKTLELEPNLEEPRFELIKLHKALAKPRRVIEIYNEILKRNPKNTRASIELALFYIKTGEPAKGAALLERLGLRSKSDIEVIRTLIRLYLDPKKYDEVIILIGGMLKGAPDNSELHYVMGVAYDNKKEIELAITHFKRVHSDSKFYQNALIHIAFLYQEQGNLDEAIAFMEGVIRKIPDNPEFYLYIGTFYEEKEDFQRAIDYLKKGIELDPSNSKLHFRLGVTYDKGGRKKDSIQAMKRTIELDPKDARALNYLGYTYADLGQNLDEAENLILKALEYKPHDGYITDSLGWIYYKKGLFEKAAGYLQKAVGLVPTDPIILEHLGDVYMKMDQKKEALEFYEKSLLNKKKDKEELEKKIEELKKSGF